jgi:hypothetical protein
VALKTRTSSRYCWGEPSRASTPLSKREKDALDFLLASDFPGVEALREQAEVASVVGRCPCGCATIELAIDAAQASPASSHEPIPVEARTRDKSEGGPLELLLFVRKGWLEGLEIVFYGNDIPTEFPAPKAFEAPVTRSP